MRAQAEYAGEVGSSLLMVMMFGMILLKRTGNEVNNLFGGEIILFIKLSGCVSEPEAKVI